MEEKLKQKIIQSIRLHSRFAENWEKLKDTEIGMCFVAQTEWQFVRELEEILDCLLQHEDEEEE